MTQFVLGIDPGVHGALSLNSRTTCKTWDVPILAVKRGKTVKNALDAHALFALVRSLAAFEPLAVIEDVGGLPGQSAPNSFSFGFTTGLMTGALVAAGIPFERVAPVVWKRQLRVPPSADGARAVASRLLPHAVDQWPLKKHDGRAEAALIALYGFRYILEQRVA